MLQLFRYQEDGEDEIRIEYQRGIRSVLYVLPTGGGKTYVFTDITKKSSAKGGVILIMVHRKELLHQACMSLASMGVPHGILAPRPKVNSIVNFQLETIGKSYFDSGSRVQVASVQTFAQPKNLKRYAHRFNLMILDEGHHAVAGQWRDSINAAHHAKVLGVTATPMRADGQGLGVAAGGVYESMVKGPSVRELIGMGRLCEPEVYAPSNNLNIKNTDLKSKKKTTERVRASSIVGDAVDHYKRIVKGKPAIAFCQSVFDAESTAHKFKQSGIKSVAISGKTDDYTRDSAIRGLANGSVQVLTSCDIVSEGTDIPVVEAAILLRPTDSEALYLQ